mmetsp:Transcript_66475/g.110053  ORF Transcript_66475/g.110053 Transcript_66475/m.110053 type:complete len:246 (+) Transcript_66475:90-827(+)
MGSREDAIVPYATSRSRSRSRAAALAAGTRRRRRRCPKRRRHLDLRPPRHHRSMKKSRGNHGGGKADRLALVLVLAGHRHQGLGLEMRRLDSSGGRVPRKVAATPTERRAVQRSLRRPRGGKAAASALALRSSAKAGIARVRTGSVLSESAKRRSRKSVKRGSSGKSSNQDTRSVQAPTATAAAHLEALARQALAPATLVMREAADLRQLKPRRRGRRLRLGPHHAVPILGCWDFRLMPIPRKTT